MIAQNTHNQLLDRPAIRFLLDRNEGRLETFDLTTGQVYVSQVRYLPGRNGSLRLQLSGDSEHAQAIREDGYTTLTVQDTQRTRRMPLLDEDGQPTQHAIVHVNVMTDVNHVDRDDRLEVQLSIRDMQVYLRTMSPVS